MHDRQRSALQSPPAAVWPPDDTEESVLGTNLHQEAITNLRLGLNELAAALTPPGGERPWHAFSQTTITGWRRRDGSRYTTLPEVYVYGRTLDLRRPSLQLKRDGPPLLVIEVLSPTTYQSDLDLQDGKPYSYALGGVGEYLALDPAGEFLDEQGRGWRLHEGVYLPWLPDANGRWRSEQLRAMIGLDGIQVAVFGPDGGRQLREGEFHSALARQAEEIALQAEEIAALRRRLNAPLDD